VRVPASRDVGPSAASKRQDEAVVDLMPHVVVMDRDLTLTPMVSNMLACIALGRDIVHMQFECTAQSNAFCYAFNNRCAAPPASSRADDRHNCPRPALTVV